MDTMALPKPGQNAAPIEPYIGLSHPWRSPKNRVRDAILVPLIAVSIITAAFLPVRLQTTGATVDEITVITATNQTRLANGLAPLESDKALADAAEAKAEDMIANGYFAHYYNGHTPWQFIDAAAGTDWKVAGENLAKNYDSTGALMDAWMASPTHKENILNASYERIGVAVVRAQLSDGTPVSVTVQMFTGG